MQEFNTKNLNLLNHNPEDGSAPSQAAQEVLALAENEDGMSPQYNPNSGKGANN
jgi:hypothetical protein